MFKTLTLAFVGATFVAGSATAAVVTNETSIFAGGNYTDAAALQPEDGAEFTYNVENDLTVDQISFSGTGSNNGQDLGAVRFGIESETYNFNLDRMMTYDFELNQFGSTASGDFSLNNNAMPNNGSFMSGDVFSIFFVEDGRDTPVSVTASFETDAPDTPVVPVPAALPLLVGALGALGLVRRRAA